MGGRLNSFAVSAPCPCWGPVYTLNKVTVGDSLGLRLSLAASWISLAGTQRFCKKSGGWCDSQECLQDAGAGVHPRRLHRDLGSRAVGLQWHLKADSPVCAALYAALLLATNALNEDFWLISPKPPGSNFHVDIISLSIWLGAGVYQWLSLKHLWYILVLSQCVLSETYFLKTSRPLVLSRKNVNHTLGEPSTVPVPNFWFHCRVAITQLPARVIPLLLCSRNYQDSVGAACVLGRTCFGQDNCCCRELGMTALSIGSRKQHFNDERLIWNCVIFVPLY